jgi:hypothetical protein
MIDSGALKKLGKIFSVEAVVTGSFVTLGRETVLNARLIDIESGVIIAAAESAVERQWFDSQESILASGNSSALWIPAPAFDVDVPPLPQNDFLELRDAPNEPSCENASRRIDELEEKILDIKARHWAARLKEGVASTSLKVNPGSTISDPALRKSFYDRMKYWYQMENTPRLTPAEVRLFVSIDEKAYSLYRECGI